MKIISFDGDYNSKIKRDPKQGLLFNLFQKNIVNNPNFSLGIYTVPREFEMRLDRISNYLYGSADYVEELMVINDIINPYSVKEGQIIYFCDVNALSSLITTDDLADTQISGQISNPSQVTNNLANNNLQQITVSNDFKIQIINSFE